MTSLLAVACCSGAAAAGSALLFDADNGHVLYAEDPDTPWYPASLTKMMTAYLAFEAIRDHKATNDTKIFMSQLARSQPPTKLGLKVGADIALGDALTALMMRSANDLAVAIAEGLGGDVQSWVKMMNQKAADLGMSHTHFINPNGLPAEQQVTTARDMGLLAQALLRDFPDRMGIYAMTEATINKIQIGTHNSLLGSYPGADGIKTGYTCASGYNLAASATRDGHKLIAVLLGEESNAKRTARAAALLDSGFRTREWKELYPIARVDNLPYQVGGGFEPDSVMLARFRDCAAPPPPPKETASASDNKTVAGAKPKKPAAKHVVKKKKRHVRPID